MEITFNLNDRKNSNRLSDRIINSGDHIFKEFLSDDCVQKFLMKGEMTETNREIAHRRLKDFNYASFLSEVLMDAKRLTDDPKEKEFFDRFISELEVPYNAYVIKYEDIFGKADPKVAESPIGQWMYIYKCHFLTTSSKGPFLKPVVALIATYLTAEAILDYLKSCPNYSENNFAKMLLYEDFKVKPVISLLRQMVDKREDEVSEKEFKELSEVFGRGVAYDVQIMRHNLKTGQWFEG